VHLVNAVKLLHSYAVGNSERCYFVCIMPLVK